MTELHLPWLELAILTPLLGACSVARVRIPQHAQRVCTIICAATLFFAFGAWQDFLALHVREAQDRWHIVANFLGANAVAVDELSAPLFPLVALLYWMNAIATMGTKLKRFSFSAMLLSESILLATFSCKDRWGIIVLLALGAIPPLYELLVRRRSIGVYASHMALFFLLLVAGELGIATLGADADGLSLPVLLLTAAVLLRSGIVPVHCWMTDLFENATFGTALLFQTPLVGAYAAIRLLLPVASDGVLHSVAILSLVTSLYAGAMAIVQREARRFFAYLLLSHMSLVLVGLETATNISLTGALSVWLAASLALTGFGLTLRSLEARMGRLSLAVYHGLFEQTPMLAGFFLLTGLASIGFPGTIGFVATEMLVDGTVNAYPQIGFAIVLASALQGIAVLQAYFRLFTGARHATTIPMECRPAERFAVLTLTVLILGGGLLPQPGVESRYRAALEIVKNRQSISSNIPETTAALDRMANSKTKGINRGP